MTKARQSPRGACTFYGLSVACWLALILTPGSAKADLEGTIKVPESFPPLPSAEGMPPLVEPAPLNGAWAQPDHRPLGVHLSNYDLTQAQIDAAESTGCQLTRLAIPMEHFLAEVEPDWAVLDQVVSRLRRAGFEILPVLTAKAAVPEFYIPFCEAVATRYSETFTYYQLLDNINYKIGLASRDYADLLSLARTAIVLADRDAVIVSGGVRGADLTYLDMLQQQGALRSLDVIALNLYPPKGAIEQLSQGPLAAHSLPFALDAVNWARRHGKRVWVTSFGISTCYTWVGVDQAVQAALYARGALYLGWLGVERVIFAAIQDTDPSFQRPADCCGLLDVTGAPKASYYVLRALNQAVTGAYHIPPPFRWQGATYQLPEASDLLVAAELLDVPGADVITEFRVHNISVYGFWFYEAATEEYRLVYWLGEQPAYPTLLTLQLGHIGLTPLERFALLDRSPSAVDYSAAQDCLFLPRLPVDIIPGVIRFEVNEHGRPS